MKVLLAILALISVAAAIAPLLNHDAPEKIDGQYIVVFKKHLTIAHRNTHVSELVNRRLGNGERVIRTFDIGNLIGYSAKLSKDSLAAELAHPNIEYIEQDQVVRMFADDTKTQTGATWGIDRIDQANLPLDQTYHYFGSGGADVIVYVIDTGIRITHSEFQRENGTSRATWGFSAIDGEDSDGNGHGTHCSGTIGGKTYGVAKNVSLIAVKVLDNGGSGSWEGVIAGIDWVTKHHIARGANARSVGSMSLGGGVAPTVDAAINASIKAEVNYAIAAGNSYAANACNYSPARVPNAVTVGATSITDARSSFSNIGPCVDIFAPGQDITSSWSTSDTATNTISGTSMATPHVAGALAVHLGHLAAEGITKTPSPADNQDWIKSVSTKGKVTNPGTGSPNNLLFSPSAN